jgi:predicted CXXCH cytochrome family protein
MICIPKEDGMRTTVCLIGVLFILYLSLPALALNEQQKAENGGNKYCLDCHSGKEAVKTFSDGSSISTYVDPHAFNKSVHGTLSCIACHQEFSERQHPNRSFRDRLQYQIMTSRRCRDCHPDTAIKSRPIHVAMLKTEKTGEAIVCTTCHSAHAVVRVSAGTVVTSEDKYCMGCHDHEGKMGFINGEAVPTRVKTAEILDSPHRDIGCSDCHFGFSAEDHPKKKFRSEREYRHSSAEICRRCHYDKYAKVSEGIHYAMLNVGRLDAPTCVDCHGTHAISSPAKNRLAVVEKCAACHSAVYIAYSKSVHGSALFNENNRDVAICTDCHSSHSIKDPASSDFHDYIPDKCSTCHSNATIMGKYGLSTEVVKTYLSDFHGMTLSLYRSETRRRYSPPPTMAVCTDCHGIHDIARVSGSDMNAMKSKLLKRCSSCHPGATENFPDAWLSHYTPSFRVAPMIFITEKFYKIMLPLTVVGLLFLVLLDLWRYLKNR